jgi:hypothetical protein
VQPADCRRCRNAAQRKRGGPRTPESSSALSESAGITISAPKFPTEPAGSDGAPLGWLLLRPISSQELPIRPGHLPLVQDIKANPTNRDGSRRHRARGWSPLGPRQLLAVLLNCCDVELMQPRGLQDPWSSSEFVDDGHPPPRKHVAPWPGNLRT